MRSFSKISAIENMADKTFRPMLTYADEAHRGKGYGKYLMEYWECEMKRQGYGMLLVSTQANENAQHFYRRLGYKDCGGFVIDIPRYAQPMELFFIKAI